MANFSNRFKTTPLIIKKIVFKNSMKALSLKSENRMMISLYENIIFIWILLTNLYLNSFL